MTTIDAPRAPEAHSDIVYPSAIPFVLVHLACFAAIWTGVTWQAVALCVALYWLRMFAIGAGYHRYFSHRAYATGRVFQFILAFLAQTHRAEERAVVGGQASPSPSPFRHRGRRPFAAPHAASSTATRLDLRARHDATDLVKIADFAQLSRADVAAPATSCCRPSSLAVLCFAGRRLAGTGRRLLLEHGAGLSRRPSASIRWRMCAAAGAM